MSPQNGARIKNKIDKRDFDANRPLLADHDSTDEENAPIGRLSADSASTDRPGESLLNHVVDNIVERDRQKMKKEVIRILSFAWSVVSWYEACLSLTIIHFN
jgi:hypothetical protein